MVDTVRVNTFRWSWGAPSAVVIEREHADHEGRVAHLHGGYGRDTHESPGKFFMNDTEEGGVSSGSSLSMVS